MVYANIFPNNDKFSKTIKIQTIKGTISQLANTTLIQARAMNIFIVCAKSYHKLFRT